MHRTHFFSNLEVAKNCNPDRSPQGLNQNLAESSRRAAKMHNSQNKVKSNTLIDFYFFVYNHEDKKAPGGGPGKIFLETLDVVLMRRSCTLAE
ncbi:MAG: hypothetical protein AABM64_18495 [Pseudomonadota bacterium]